MKKEGIIELIAKRESINGYLSSAQFSEEVKAKTKQVYTEEFTNEIINNTLSAVLPMIEQLNK